MIHVRQLFDGRYAVRLIVLSVTILFSVVRLWPGFAFSAQEPPSIWVAESRGVLNLDRDTGNTVFEIPISPDARTLSVDGEPRVCAANQQMRDRMMA